MLKRLLIIISLFFTSDLYAASFDIALSDESAQFKTQMPVGGTTLGRSEIALGFLYHDEERYVLDTALLVIDVAGSKTPGLELGVGPKAYYIDSNLGTAFSIALGGQMRYKMRNLPRYFVSAKVFYAPGIVSFGDAKDVYEFGIYANYELLPTADIYLGYHHIHADFDQGSQSVDESLMFGMKVGF